MPDVGLLGPPGWVVSAFEYATGRADRNSTVTEQIRLAREAGYTGTRAQLIAIGQGLLSADAFAAGQGGGPGSDRVAPGRPAGVGVIGTPPLIPIPALPGVPGSGPPIAVPPGTPSFPGGPSIPDTIPPRVGVGSGAIGAVLARVIGWGAGALFYPRSTSNADVVCIDTDYGPWCPPGMPNVPAPVAVPGSRPGRRSRPRVVPGTRTGRRSRPRVAPANPVVPQARPGGRPITISRPQVIPQPRVIDAPLPMPRSLPPPAASFPTPGSAGMPATVPATRTLPASAVAALLLPALGAWVSTQLGTRTGLGSMANPLTRPMPGLGTAPLPSIGSFPSPALNPATQPLTAYSTALAPSAAQDLDRQCRERAKSKRKRKKRKPRSVCYRGTFYELKNGTRKQRKEKITCR